MAYNREKAVAYAHRWAYDRNPRYADFQLMGGDCTNFISQCLHAGGARMNYTREHGWYFINLQKRSPSWSGVEFLFRFLTTNRGAGPYASVASAADMMPGDVVQLKFDGASQFGHSLLVVAVGDIPDNSNILIATHTYDSDYRPLDSWTGVTYRYLHVEGAR